MSDAAYRGYVPGKWVLAGEHSVLRGAPAVALLHPAFGLTLTFVPGDALAIEPESARDPVLGILNTLGHSPQGRLSIESTIPIGSGLGSSAALCVALSRWAKPDADERELFNLARSLEDRFHGKSSGMDVAVALAGAPIVFQLKRSPSGFDDGVARKLALRELPRFEFHDTGLRSRTSDCVRQVEALRARDPDRGKLADERMAGASLLAEHGLSAYSAGRREEGLQLVAHAMGDAQACFVDWELVPESVAAEARRIRERGARAVKLTGAGAGGFLVSLWD